MLLLLVIFCSANMHAMLTTPIKTPLMQNSIVQKRFFHKTEKKHIKRLLENNKFDGLRTFFEHQKSLTKPELTFTQNALAQKRELLLQQLSKFDQSTYKLRFDAVSLTANLSVASVSFAKTMLPILDGLPYSSSTAVIGLGAAALSCWNAKAISETLLDAHYQPLSRVKYRKLLQEIDQLSHQINALHNGNVDTTDC